MRVVNNNSPHGNKIDVAAAQLRYHEVNNPHHQRADCDSAHSVGKS